VKKQKITAAILQISRFLTGRNKIYSVEKEEIIG